MGRHSTWTEEHHPRAFDGKFARTSGNGRSGRNDSPRKRGMPDSISGADIPVRGGKELALDYHPDGSLTISTGKASMHLPGDTAIDLLHGLQDAELDAPGKERWIKTVERDADGRPQAPSLAALIRTEDDDTVSLRLAPNDTPSVGELRNAPDLRLNSKDLEQLDHANTRRESATRLDTGNGDVDLHITDDSQFAIRHLGDDGRPVDVKLSPRDYAKISNAVDVVIDGWDENDDTLDEDDVVTQRTVPTSTGNVTIELQGDWQGDNPGDRLTITADDGSWGIVVDGPQQEAFAAALSKLEDAGERLQIYSPEMKWKK